MTKPNSTLIAIILDRSGSMQSVKDATIKGFNEFLQGQKAVPGECKLSLVQFDDQYEVNYLAKNIQEATPLNHETYQPRGSTALLDAIGRTIIQTGKGLEGMAETDRPSKVIIVIQTDGFENASREFDKLKISDMIKHQRDVYQWEFIFLGAGQDAIMSAASIGISSATAMTYNNTETGTKAMYSTLSASISRSRSGGSSAWTDEERKVNS